MENGDPTQSPGAVSSPDTSQPPAAQPATAQPDLASLLSEFEASTAPKPEPQAPATQAPQARTLAEGKDPNAFDPVATAMKGFEDWQKANRLEGEVQALSGELAKARAYVDHQDFDKAVGAAEKMLADADLLVPGGFVRDKLLAMSVEHPELVHLFDHRAENPQAYARAMKKVNHKIFEAARSMPDPEATATRYAVAAAVRGTSTKNYAEPTPQYGSMTEAEFAKEKSKFGL